MPIDTPKPDKFLGYGDVKVIETTQKSIQLHVPAKVRDALKLNKEQRMRVEVNLKTKQILYTLVK